MNQTAKKLPILALMLAAILGGFMTIPAHAGLGRIDQINAQHCARGSQASCHALYTDGLMSRCEYCTIIHRHQQTDPELCRERNIDAEQSASARGMIQDQLEAIDQEAQDEAEAEATPRVEFIPAPAPRPVRRRAHCRQQPKASLHAIAIVHNLDAEPAIAYLDDTEVPDEIAPGGLSIIWSSQPMNRELVFKRIGKKKLGRVILTVPLPIEPDKGKVETVDLPDGRKVTAQTITLTEVR